MLVAISVSGCTHWEFMASLTRSGSSATAMSSTSRPPAEEEPIQGRKVNLKPMVQEFYRCMGWDEQGRPRPKILQKFGLSLVNSSEL